MCNYSLNVHRGPGQASYTQLCSTNITLLPYNYLFFAKKKNGAFQCMLYVVKVQICLPNFKNACMSGFVGVSK